MSYPVEFAAVVPLIKKILKQKNMTYRDLAKGLHMSEANVKKIMAGKDCSLKRLNQICDKLDLTLFELLEMIRHRQVRRVVLNPAQQELLTNDETTLLLYFKLAFEGVSAAAAQKQMTLGDVAFRKKLVALEVAGLLKPKADGAWAPPDDHIGIWPNEGPVAKLVIEEWSAAVLRSAVHSQPTATPCDFALRYFRMSERSAKEFREKMTALLQEYDRISEVEMKIHPAACDLSVLYAAVPESLSNLRLRQRK